MNPETFRIDFSFEIATSGNLLKTSEPSSPPTASLAGKEEGSITPRFAELHLILDGIGGVPDKDGEEKDETP